MFMDGWAAGRNRSAEVWTSGYGEESMGSAGGASTASTQEGWTPRQRVEAELSCCVNRVQR